MPWPERRAAAVALAATLILAVLVFGLGLGASALAALAQPQDDDHVDTGGRGAVRPPVTAPPGGPGQGAALLAAVDAQIAIAEGARTTVADRLATRRAERTAHIRAAYKALRAGAAPLWVDPAERAAAVRRRVAIRRILGLDRAEVEQLALELADLTTATTRLAAERASAAGPIAWPAAGSLSPPVPGDVVRHTGRILHERSGATLSRRGVDLAAAPGRDVTAVADGTVRYAGPIRGLDAGVIIDHGIHGSGPGVDAGAGHGAGDFTSIVAKLSDVAVQAGATVQRGQLLGHAARTRVYLEVRLPVGDAGLPIDPEPLLGPAAP